VFGALALELHGQLRDLRLEVIDQPEADVDVVPPRVGDLQAIQQLAAGVAEQIGDRARVPEGDQRSVDAVLQRRAVADRCNLKRASSRSRRTDGSGSQISGTRSRADSVASTGRRSCRSCTPTAPGP
jgi:hypothetical protein